MKKSTLMFALIFVVLVAGGVVFFLQGNQFVLKSPASEKMYTIGVVRTPPTLDLVWESFRAKMKELGYAEGRNVTYKVTEIGRDYPETKQKVAALISRERLDLVYPLGSLPARAAKEITAQQGGKLPVVFGVVADPVRAKLVNSLRSSGNNLTGVVSANEIVSSKRVELFLEAVPTIKRIVFPWNDGVTTGIETFRETVRILGLTLVEKHVTNVDELDSFLATFPFRRGDGLFRASDSLVGTRSATMARLALDKKIPLSGTNSFDPEQGALMSYGADFRKMGEQGAILVDKVLRGGKAPSDLPIELPAEFELIVNLKTARALGITIPPAFLSKTTRLIQ